ncbi:MAG: hypothetical protein WAO98_03060 [Alphaproteobacteria bacterium]
MKKLLLVLTALLLASCIDVDDFGAAWDKASVDPSVIGNWKQISASSTTAENERNIGEITRARLLEDALQIEHEFTNPEEAEDPIYPVKTMKIGSYHFFITGPHNGGMVRYVVADNKITTYVLNAEATAAFIKKKFPKEKNVTKDIALNDPYIKIGIFNDEATKILASIPESDIYWHQQAVYEKAP